MDLEQRREKAIEFKRNGCNCAQSVVMACQDLCNVDPNVLKQISAGFGGGMGCMEATCGALSGAVMIAGLLSEGKQTTKLARMMLKDFEAMCGAVLCKDLKGRDTRVILCPCEDCVRNAISVLDKNMEISR